MNFPGSTPHFVLVHGAGGGGWCWYKIRALMEISGYKVSCIDLKSGGIDPTKPDLILSFDDYNKPLIDFMASLPENEQVILVGHSAGGLSVTHAARKFAGKIKVAVYVVAVMLRSGYLTDQDVKDGAPDFLEIHDKFDFRFGLGLDKPPTSAVVKKELQREVFYHMSPQEDSILSAMLLKPAPIPALLSARFAEEDDDVDKVPRVYIRATQDKIMKPELQEAMIKKWPPAETYVVEGDHSLYFSAAFLLFGLFVKIEASF